MINFEEPFLVGLIGGQLFDTDNNTLFPWYTRNFLKELTSWDIKDWKVFEYGSGESTKWWRGKVRLVESIDSNQSWATKTGSFYSNQKDEFINYPLTLINDEKFDCVIIDGDPVEWRDDCTAVAIACTKPGGIIIIDNYNQKTVNLEFLPKTEELLKDKKKFVFQQLGHQDWKTAYWIM